MKYLATFLFTLVFFWTATPVLAVADPPLFSCTQPIGTKIASYESGVHGIPGDLTRYEGSDEVYQVDQDHVLQCLCVANSTSGIQSNWWNVSALTESERETFIRRGWEFVPDGSAWGLASAPYLVKNDAFSCGGVGGGNSSGRSSGRRSGGSSSGTGGDSQRGEVLSASTLAATGNTSRILGLFLAASLFGWVTYRLSRE